MGDTHVGNGAPKSQVTGYMEVGDRRKRSWGQGVGNRLSEHCALGRWGGLAEGAARLPVVAEAGEVRWGEKERLTGREVGALPGALTLPPNTG